MKRALALSVVLVAAALVLDSCSSQPIVPEGKNVKLSRESAAKDCVELGPVMGAVKTSTGKVEDAIEDMKLDAARKGANFVHMEATGAMGTSASGTAYQCP